MHLKLQVESGRSLNVCSHLYFLMLLDYGTLLVDLGASL
jgi:hypothetical protein